MTSKDNNHDFYAITNEEIYKTILSIKDTQDKMWRVQHDILEQTKKTNGRVTVLENTTHILTTSTIGIARNAENIDLLTKSSIGIWIGRHPFKFAWLVIIFLSFWVAEIRNPIVNEIIKLLI